jgi:hypothetical protein
VYKQVKCIAYHRAGFIHLMPENIPLIHFLAPLIKFNWLITGIYRILVAGKT